MKQHQDQHNKFGGNQSARGEEEEERVKEGEISRMRVIVPLQGIVQGRGGYVVGSVIPCALLYFLQLYLKSRRRGLGPGPSSNGHNDGPEPSSQPPPRRPPRIPPAPPFVVPRLLNMTEGEDSLYYKGWRAYESNPYNPETNPQGIIQMGLAENQLSVDLIEEWLKTHSEASSTTEIDEIARYQDTYGTQELRKVLASFMGKVMNVDFEEPRIVLTAGATAAIETLGFCLADHGNAFLVPSPYYPGFDRDLKLRAGVELVPVPCRSSDNFFVTMTALERAFKQTKKRGLAVRALLITNPSNPVGNIMSPEMLSRLLDFSREKNIHLICDEIYAASVYDSPHFTSIAKVLETGDFDKSRVHIIYGLSKDLCIPGFRVGVLYSYNDRVLKAAQKMSRFCSISSQTQTLLTSLLSDDEFLEKFIPENNRRLKERSDNFVQILRNEGVDYIKGNACLYCWVGMSSWMPTYSEKGEFKFWEKLLSEAKINATPGSACHCIEPGWFRFCFATLNDHEMTVAIERIQDFIRRCKSSLKK